MPNLRALPVLVAAIAGLAIVTVALAATLVLDDDGPDESVAETSAVSTPTRTPAPTSTPAPPGEAPSEIPDALWVRIQDLPEKLRANLLSQFEVGGIDVAAVERVVVEYENRNQGVRVGAVLEATDSLLRLEVYETGERAELVINDETVLRRGRDDIAPGDLMPNELVMVLSMDDGVTAFSVTAFGVEAP